MRPSMRPLAAAILLCLMGCEVDVGGSAAAQDPFQDIPPEVGLPGVGDPIDGGDSGTPGAPGEMPGGPSVSPGPPSVPTELEPDPGDGMAPAVPSPPDPAPLMPDPDPPAPEPPNPVEQVPTYPTLDTPLLVGCPAGPNFVGCGVDYLETDGYCHRLGSNGTPATSYQVYDWERSCNVVCLEEDGQAEGSELVTSRCYAGERASGSYCRIPCVL